MRAKIRKLLHAAILLAAAAPWIIAYFMLALAAGMCWAADRVWPNATRGNCWSFALHRWCKERGVLALSFVEDARLLRIFPVVHCALLPSLLPCGPAFRSQSPRLHCPARWCPRHAAPMRLRSPGIP